MQQMSRSRISQSPDPGRDIVQRLAEMGYQLEPEALKVICRHPGSKEDLLRRIVSSTDRSVAVIGTSHLSCLLDSSAPPALLPVRPSFAPSDSALPLSCAPHPERECIAELNCDITGRSTCVGDYSDFVHYFRDRYAKIREMLSRRLNSRPIESLGKSTTGREVSLIGMVMDVRTTAKGNRVIELEDPTGLITAVVQKDSEIYEQSALIITDEVIGVTGTSDGNGRLFVKSILWPDMPNHTAPLEKGSGCALLLSDLHVGSKYFMADAWESFLNWLSGKEDDPSGLSAQVRYIVIAGDLVDGIGIYPGQEKDLALMDIHAQYQEAARWLNAIRKDIKVIIAPGNHDMVRQAEPQPALPEDIKSYFREDMLFVGNPAWVTLGGVSVLIYHGRSIDDLVLRLPGISYSAPEKAMIEMLRRRHLSPIYGSRVSIAPEHEDHYVISRPPSILHCGHVHTVGIARYKGVVVINSGTWQSQTDFQKKMNIQPVAGVVPAVDLATMKVRKLIFS
ncbi:MAG: DNA-directed DNA polymerase II small subunit [Methanothrix sp.]|jgi:DNA polymerase II small subunit|nr:DNA-directed DNA polymerase II small subunit [Methanothrix sp.]